MRSLACLFVVAISTPALAQAPGEVQPVPSSSAPASPAEQKDPDTAMVLSAGVTLGGTILTIAGAKAGSGAAALLGVGTMFLGPSSGRWYAGGSGAGSLALRGASGLAMLYGFALILQSVDCEGVDCQDHDGVAAALLFGGLGVWAGTSIYDVVMAGREAKSWNQRHETYALRLKPTMISIAGHHAMGLALGGHF